MADPIVLEYELKPEDYADWMTFHSGRSSLHRGHRTRALLLLPALWLALTVWAGPSVSAFIVWALFTTIWVALLPPYLRRQTRGNMRKLAQQGLSRGSVGPHRLVVDERGIVEITPYSENRTFWHGIEAVVESPRHILVYLGTHSAVIVPKHAFSSELTIGAFVDGMNELREAADSGSLPPDAKNPPGDRLS
jgi:hypothetical protein